jgi:hypothetical protein
MLFYKVSAKKGININEAYQTLIQEAFDYVMKKKNKDNNVSLFEDEAEKEKKNNKKCC